MRPSSRVHPPLWQRRWLELSLLALAVTGVAWLALHLGRDPESLPPPAEGWLMRVHGLCSLAALLGLGMVLGAHIPAGWQMGSRPAHRRSRHSGLGVALLLGLAVAVAYGLLYLIPESWHEPAGWLHAGLALSALAPWIWHLRSARRRRGAQAG